MPIADGTRLGAYTIQAPLGAGGMGEVYRATDTRLKRQVAVKILAASFAGDSDRLARFQREAEVLASLNHPHIATVYGFEDSDGIRALVMELVDGPTLAERIAGGPLPVDEALPIATQIAEALEAAHERGIIHRDLKPANIKVREDGTVKVLDFGLAKLAEREGAIVAGRDDPAQSPTLTSPAAMTAMGVILGSAAYMSPEQARGRPVDKRTDIWAFGAVLYEMLTGTRAFEGEDVTDTLASVVKSTPNWAALPADVAPAVVTLVQRCLEKDRHKRIGDIAVARFLLADHAAIDAIPAAAPAVRTPPRQRWRQTLMWSVAALLAGAAIGWFLPRHAPPVAVMHLQMGVSPADQLVGSIASVRPSRTAMAISPDGRTIVFAGTRGALTQLYVRAVDRPDATPLAGTEGASAPFYSPDGAWIGFWVGNTIKKVPSAGGPPAVIAAVPGNRNWGASWGQDGTIFLAGTSGIFRVSSAGGTPAAVTTSTGERHLLPHALPGGKFLIFTAMTSADWNSSKVVLHPLDGGERRVLVPGADGRYVNSGHLVYLKSGTLMAVPFDLRSRQVTGEPVALIDGVMQGMNAPNGGDETGAGQFAISASGTLAHVRGGIGPIREKSLVWVDRKGAERRVGTWTGPYMSPRLSPDGQRIAVSARRGASRTTDIWVYDLGRDAPTRLTFDADNNSPVWAPDSKRLVYGAGNLHAIDAVGGGTPERLVTSDYLHFPSSWSAGANAIAFLQRPGPDDALNGIWVLPMDVPAAERKPRLFLQSRFSLTHPDFSPDGGWIAYVSNESGNQDVYVQPYPGPGEKIRISTSGGTEPIWTANGRELLYRTGTGSTSPFVSVTVRSTSPFQTDPPRILFEAKPGEYDSTGPVRGWDASADGQRFLLAKAVAVDDKPVTAIHVVLNWTEELRRLVPSR
jgi:Tol biopolymer transport system component